MVQLFQDGLSMQEVARRTGRTFQTVRLHLIRSGVHQPRYRHVSDGTAVCTRCKVRKAVGEFPSLDGGKYLCRACMAVANESYSLARLGLTVTDYERLLEEQGGRCAICGCPEGHRSCYGKKCKLAVDHEHQTGQVRGLLCNNCNRGLGRFKDSLSLLEAAIRYLKRKQTGSEKADHTNNC
jgi:hypothetical protein